MATSSPTAPVSSCAGDCNDDLVVSLDELITGVDIGLGRSPLAVCPAFDSEADGVVRIDELVRAVAIALHGCEAPTPTHTLRPTRTPRR
jgi:hypothetical protein